MSVPFDDWTREEKEEYANIRMAQMKLLNEKFKQRHAEVEKDRIEAEANNSSVTSIMSIQKEIVSEGNYGSTTDERCSKPKVKEREWDKGKTNFDLEDWNSPKDQHRQPYWRGRSNSRPMKKTGNEFKEEHWRDRPVHNKDSHDSSRFREFGRSWGNRKFSETKSQGGDNYRNDSSFSKQKNRGYNRERNNYASCRSYQNSKLNDSIKKTHVGAHGLASQSLGESEVEPVKQSTKLEKDHMWRDKGINEVHHRQIRVEKWIHSINNVCLEDDSLNTSKVEEVDYQDKSGSKFKYTSYGKDKSLKTNSKISDPEGIWEDVDVDNSYPYQYSWNDNPSKSALMPFPDENPSRKNDEYNQSTMQRASNKQWKNKSYSKNQSSSEYSGTYENQAFKKRDRISSRKIPDNHTFRKGNYVECKLKTELRPSSSSRRFEDSDPSVDNRDWSSHDLEFDDSVLVKIKSHTVKRTVFNTFNYTEKDSIQQNIPENELLDYSGNETEMTANLNPTQYSENIPLNSMGSSVRDEGIWEDCDYENIPLNSMGSSVWDDGIWEDCDYDDSIQNIKSVEKKLDSAIFYQKSSSQALVAHSEMDHSSCDNFQTADEKVHLNDENPSKVGGLGSVEKDTVIEDNSELSSLIVESNIDESLHVLNIGDKNNDNGDAGEKVHLNDENPSEVEDLGSVEKDTVIESNSELSSLIIDSNIDASLHVLNIDDKNDDNVEADEKVHLNDENPSKVEDLGSVKKDTVIESNSEFSSLIDESNIDESLHVLNFDDKNIDNVECLNTAHPEVSDSFGKNLENAEILSNKNMQLEVSFDAETHASPTNNCTAMELHAEMCVVSKSIENPIENADEDNSEFSYPNLSVKNSQEVETTIQKGSTNIATSEEEKDINTETSEKEKYENVMSSNWQENAAISEEEDLNAFTYEEGDGNTVTYKKDEDETASKEEDNGATFKEEDVNTVTSKEGQVQKILERVEIKATSKKYEVGIAATSKKEKDENSLTSKKVKDNKNFEKLIGTPDNLPA